MGVLLRFGAVRHPARVSVHRTAGREKTSPSSDGSCTALNLTIDHAFVVDRV